ncbi:MAG: DUF4982 domain-containing protein, partial [Defluviitaleaceae bacterium]|nr:DUF4982 domain-containing protein [Defluviitaleaceae bacterium]
MSSRITQSLNLDWKFIRGDVPQAWQNRYDDSHWRDVNVPHDWSVEEPFDIKHSSGTGYLAGGTGWYRKHFTLPMHTPEHRVTICFEGVYNNSQVWCNGYYLGKRPYGYSEFVYDISHCVRQDGSENILVVRVDHANTGDSRWFTGSGIYRDVSITITQNICIDSYGVFAYTVDAAKGNINVDTVLLNGSDNDTEVTVNQKLLLDGKAVAEASNTQALPKGTVSMTQPITVPNPVLWSPETPVLYTLVTQVVQGGKVIDTVETKTGIRDILYDADKGFFLNGINYTLKGVCLHHDAGCLGAAVRPKVWARRLKALKAMGCNAIRMAHNPHMTALYDLCDSMGFFVIDEAFDEWEGVKNKWTTGHNVYPPAHYGYYEDFPVWGEADLTAMVLRDRNHPSVILWSIGNEIDYPNDPYCHPFFDDMTGNNDKNKPAAERKYDPGKPNAERLVTISKKLSEVVKRIDTTRPVTAGLAFPELSNLTGLSSTLDVVGYNYKEQHYKADHEKYPKHILMGSENGHHPRAWQAVLDNEFISGQFLWTGIDYLGETPRWPSHGSGAGLLDLAGYEKSSYYYRQSLWSDSPVIRLAASYPIQDESQLFLPWYANKMCWNFLQGEEVDVVIYTNCQEVELVLNGVSLGKRENAGAGMPLVWRVDYAPGEVKAIGYSNGQSVENILETTGAAVAIEAKLWDETLVYDGQDMTHIELQLVDAQGRPVADTYDLLHVRIENGYLLGLENGDLADTTPYSSKSRRANKGKLLAYIGAPAGGT